MSNLTLERSLHILGPVIGHKRGVRVVIGGSRACTDGDTVYLPALPIEDRDGSVLGFGYLCHESNHVRHTDFTVGKGEGLVASLTGTLEDIRVDTLGNRAYAGGQLVQEDLIHALLRRDEATRSRTGDHPARILDHYVLWRLIHDLVGIKAAKEIAEHSETLFRDQFPPGAATKLDGLMFSVRDCESTADVKALAQSIAQMLEEEAEAEEQKAQGEREEQQASNASDAAAPSPNVLRQVLEAGEGDHAPQLGELIQQALNNQARDADPHANISMPGGVSFEPGTRKRGASTAFQFDVRGATNALRQRTAGLLQAESTCRRLITMSGRRLDAKRMYRVQNGDGRIFRCDQRGISINTAIQVLVDRSGSTSGEVIQIAREACYATGFAMQSVPGVSTAIAAFPGDTDGQLFRLSTFGERIERHAERFACLEASGGTPMAEAMLWGASQLLAQQRPRRIMLVITDGAYDAQRCRRMLTALEAVGIEVIGIGINFDVAHLFPLQRSIKAVDQLAQAMFELLTHALRTQRKLH